MRERVVLEEVKAEGGREGGREGGKERGRELKIGIDVF
jgi:predicted transposase YdaD